MHRCFSALSQCLKYQVMKYYPSSFFSKSLGFLALMTSLCLLAGVSQLQAGEVFSSDFSKGTLGGKLKTKGKLQKPGNSSLEGKK